MGAMVQPTENAQTRKILSMAPFFVKGLALRPLTITLYLSRAIMVMVQIETQPKSEPNMPYISHIRGPCKQKKTFIAVLSIKPFTFCVIYDITEK